MAFRLPSKVALPLTSQLTFSRITAAALAMSRAYSGASTFKYDALEVERSASPKPKPAPDQLVFGKITTDHMLIISWNSNTGWSRPKIQPVQPISLDPTAKTFQFASHIFEGMKAYHSESTGKVLMFRPDKNMERFISSAERCALPFDFDPHELLRCIARLIDIDRDWVPRGVPHASLYIRPVLMGTDANFKVGPINDALLYVLLSPVGSYFKAASTKPVRLFADPKYVRSWPGGVGAFKMGSNYAPAVFVQQEALKHGCEQALWLFGDDMKITEVGSMNVMTLWYNENGEKELVTAPLESGLILPGVTRDSLLKLARNWNEFLVSEREHALPEVLRALHEGRLIEMFGCGTAAVVTPVSEILFQGNIYSLPITGKSAPGSARFGRGAVENEIVSSRLLAELEAIQTGRTQHEWAFDVDDLI